MNENESSLEKMYSEFDLAEFPYFEGGLINFGYWENINIDQIGKTERIISSQNLYKLLIEELEIKSEDVVIEVGCGHGFGVQLLSEITSPKRIIGIDKFKAQLDRAKKSQASTLNNPNIELIEGAAENLPIGDKQVQKMISVEAFQHFNDPRSFFKECSRTLTSGGQLAITTFFETKKGSQEIIKKNIPTVVSGVDHFYNIDDVKNWGEEANLTLLKEYSIGDNVWQGFDHWLVACGEDKDWGRNFLSLYKEGCIDYNVIIFEK